MTPSLPPYSMNLNIYFICCYGDFSFLSFFFLFFFDHFCNFSTHILASLFINNDIYIHFVGVPVTSVPPYFYHSSNDIFFLSTLHFGGEFMVCNHKFIQPILLAGHRPEFVSLLS